MLQPHALYSAWDQHIRDTNTYRQKQHKKKFRLVAKMLIFLHCLSLSLLQVLTSNQEQVRVKDRFLKFTMLDLLGLQSSSVRAVFWFQKPLNEFRILYDFVFWNILYPASRAVCFPFPLRGTALMLIRGVLCTFYCDNLVCVLSFSFYYIISLMMLLSFK